MIIIPAINCKNFKCVKEKIKRATEFSQWVQIDIADGKFTNYKNWNNPRALRELRILNLEIHLMVEKPLTVINDWIKAGAKRIIIHCETIKVSKFKSLKVSKNIEIGLAINPNTPVKNLIPFIKNGARFVQILAVNPGLSGQKFQKRILNKIKFLKKNYPKVKIEIDGGINLQTAKLCAKAGADILVAASYIWNSKNPKQAYQTLF